MTSNETDGTRKVRRWGQYRPTWPTWKVQLHLLDPTRRTSKPPSQPATSWSPTHSHFLFMWHNGTHSMAHNAWNRQLCINMNNIIGGSWLDEPQGQNIGGLSSAAPQSRAPLAGWAYVVQQEKTSRTRNWWLVVCSPLWLSLEASH